MPIITSDPTVFVYSSFDSTTTVTITGNFTYDVNNIPVSGMVATITFDLSNDADVDQAISFAGSGPDISELITNFTATGYPSANDRFDASEDFFRAAYGGADTFIPTTGPFSQTLIGDFSNLGVGETLTSANDIFDFPTSNVGLMTIFGDGVTVSGTLNAGRDTFDFEDGNQTTGSLFFDVQTVDAGGILNGGDDILDLAADATINGTRDLTVFGDANIVRNGGVANGGDDMIVNTTGTRLEAYGDIKSLESGATLVGGNDTITTIAMSSASAGFFADVVYGDAQTIDGNSSFTGGNDIISTGGGADVIYGDYQFLISGTIIAGGNDILDGGAQDDMIFGNEGDDTLIGGSGEDSLDGGLGTDTAVFSADFSSYTFGLDGSGNLQVTDGVGTDGTDTLVDIERLQFNGSIFNLLAGTSSPDTLVGTGNNDIFIGFGDGDILLDLVDGNDVFLGGDGNDQMQGGLGGDQHFGGNGTDEARYTQSNAAVEVNLGTGVASGGHAAGDTFDSIENLAGSQFGDTLIGDNGINRLDGFTGDDLLRGRVGSGCAVWWARFRYSGLFGQWDICRRGGFSNWYRGYV